MNTLSYPAPRTLPAGDSVSFYVNDSAHAPDDGWELKYVISSATPVIVTATVEDSKHLVTITGEVSGPIPPKLYGTSFVFTKAPFRETLSGATIFILPNPLLGVPQTWAMETLTACEVAIKKLSATVNATVSVNGETYTKTSIDALMKLRDRMILTVQSELTAMGRPAGGLKKIRTRFVS